MKDSSSAHQIHANTLILVLEDFQEGFPADLSQEVREITIAGVEAKDLDHEGIHPEYA